MHLTKGEPVRCKPHSGVIEQLLPKHVIIVTKAERQNGDILKYKLPKGAIKRDVSGRLYCTWRKCPPMNSGNKRVPKGHRLCRINVYLGTHSESWNGVILKETPSRLFITKREEYFMETYYIYDKIAGQIKTELGFLVTINDIRPLTKLSQL